jgi:hypothetical protein
MPDFAEQLALLAREGFFPREIDTTNPEHLAGLRARGIEEFLVEGHRAVIVDGFTSEGTHESFQLYPLAGRPGVWVRINKMMMRIELWRLDGREMPMHVLVPRSGLKSS